MYILPHTFSYPNIVFPKPVQCQTIYLQFFRFRRASGFYALIRRYYSVVTYTLPAQVIFPTDGPESGAMVGAVITHLFILGPSAVPAIALGLLCCLVLYLHRQEALKLINRYGDLEPMSE
ncbi:MAG: hypothetical protein QMC17_05200 [Paracoccaceae bacterium]|jgi:hypothetical protein